MLLLAVCSCRQFPSSPLAMNLNGQKILECLKEVAAERRLRAGDAGLGERVREVKRFQHARFSLTYADLLASARYGAAAQFFLDDLYGPADFTRRDDEFARIVPGLVRLFPNEIVQTVVALGQLHALSEQLDTAMGRIAPAQPQAISGREYGEMWRAVGRAQDRARQIELMLVVGSALERYTRNPLLRHSLRVMRVPAQAAGLGTLQAFLERGFDTFRGMRGAEQFLDTVASREKELAARLFAGGDAPQSAADG